MNPIRNNLAWLCIVILFAFATFVAGKKYQQERENRIRLEQSFIDANQQLEYYKAKNGELVAKNDVIQLQYSELKEIYPDIIAEIQNLKIKPRLAEQYSQTVIHEHMDIETTLRDSLIFDTIPVRVFNFQNEFYNVSGILNGDTQQVHIESKDSLVQVVYRGERIHPWLWFLSRRQLQQAVSCKNPNNKIEFSKFIKITK